MRDNENKATGDVTFALTWIGIATVVCLVVGVLAGLVRGDVAGTLGPVVQWGMTAAAIGVVVAIFLRKS